MQNAEQIHNLTISRECWVTQRDLMQKYLALGETIQKLPDFIAAPFCWIHREEIDFWVDLLKANRRREAAKWN